MNTTENKTKTSGFNPLPLPRRLDRQREIVRQIVEGIEGHSGKHLSSWDTYLVLRETLADLVTLERLERGELARVEKR